MRAVMPIPALGQLNQVIPIGFKTGLRTRSINPIENQPNRKSTQSKINPAHRGRCGKRNRRSDPRAGPARNQLL